MTSDVDVRRVLEQSRNEPVVPRRHPGRWVSGALALALALWFVTGIASNDTFDFAAVSEYMFDQTIVEGVIRTLALTVLAMSIGIVLGVAAATMRMSANPVLAAIAGFYVWFFRGTPVLVQLVFWFNLGVLFDRLAVTVPGGPTLWSASTNDLITPLTAALLGLGLNEGAYMAEIVRAGILSVDRGQAAAASALGMTKAKLMRIVVLPQAMRVIVPPTGNQVIGMLKFTSLASVISYDELLGSATNIYSTNLKTLELLTVASIWYLICTSILSVGQFFLERRLASGSGVAEAPGLIARAWDRAAAPLTKRGA